MTFTLFLSSDNVDDEANNMMPFVVVEGDQGYVYVSTDNGLSWRKQTNLGKGNWKTVICSNDGKVVVADNGPEGDIYLNFTMNFTLPPKEDDWKSVGTKNGWTTLASSADMKMIAAVRNSGLLYLSTDYGSSFNMLTNIANVCDVAMSENGQYMACIQNTLGGGLYVSSDYGNSWTMYASSSNWETVAMSGNGRCLVAAENSGYIYVSDDFGESWGQRSVTGHWREVALSKDGTKIIAVQSGLNGGFIWVSIDFGMSWSQRGVKRQWSSVALNANGRTMAAVAPNDNVYVSYDGGETWVPQTASPNGNGTCVAFGVLSDKEIFQARDAPPTSMKTKVRLPTLNTTRSMQNQQYSIYLERYFLDCIWRDSEDPSDKLTANSGTSKSDKIFVTFYVGNISDNMRLLRQTDLSTTGIDCDFTLHRSSENIGELASFYEYTSKDVFDSNYWFENQYTNQHRLYASPGFYLGKVDTQALMALQRVSYISVKMENNRNDSFKSPFWHSKFLTGVSIFNDETGKYEIVKNNTISVSNFKQVSQITLTSVDKGPYTPSTLYTLDNPLHPELYEGNVQDVFAVSASSQNTLNLMNSDKTEIVMQQVAFANTASNASVLEEYVIPTGTQTANGDFLAHPLYATSDFNDYTVSFANTGLWTATSPALSGAGKTPLLPFPNGQWRGIPLLSQNTALTGTKSAFPWERQLTASQLQILDGTSTYNASLHGSQVLPTENYLYMPSGEWSQRIGERSLQVDFGQAQHVNKLQILFPKSQERWQPTRLNATIQRAWPSKSSESYVDQYPAYWHQGFQSRYPYGKNDGGQTKYIHTLTQRAQFNGEAGDMLLGSHRNNLVSTYDIDGNNFTVPVSGPNFPTIVDGPTLANVVTSEVEMGEIQTFQTSPNDVNPAFDFKRYEYGPFLQGATLSWLKRLDTLSLGDILRVTFPVAVCPKYRTADWDNVESPLQFYFSNFQQWLDQPQSERALGGVLQWYFPTAYNFFYSLPFWGAPPSMFEYSASSGNAAHAFDELDSTSWEASGYSGVNYVTNVPNYTGSTSTTYNNGSATVMGEWIQIKHPSPVKIQGYFFQPAQVPSVWIPLSVTNSSNTLVVTGPSSNDRFTITTSSNNLYDKASDGVYIGTEMLPDQRNFVYQEGSTPDYDVNGSVLVDGPVAGEWFAVEYDRPKRIKGFRLETSDLRQAPSRLAIYCKNASDSYWFNRGEYIIMDYSKTPEITDDLINGNPTGFTHWAVVISKVQLNYVIEAPANIFALYDTFLGREIRATVQQRAYLTLDDVATAVRLALEKEVDGQVTYSVTWNALQSYFEITNSATFVEVESFYTTYTSPYEFSIIETPLSQLMGLGVGGFTGNWAIGSPNPPIIPTNTSGTAMSITLDDSGDDVTQEDDQPTLFRMLGSNNGTNWTSLAYNTLHWRTRGSLSNFSVNGIQGYRYHRIVFVSTQQSTTVRISKLRLYARDYENLPYSKTIVTGNTKLFDLDYSSPNERDEIYGNCYDWLLSKFHLYQIYNGNPLQDYLVKEEYYFAPNLDQTDDASIDPVFDSYRPSYRTTAQKMINPILAEGRYAGLSIGYESTNRGVYAGNVVMRDTSADRDHKCFSWRLCHQLFDFYSKGGTVSNRVKTSDDEASQKAAFYKRFERGMLTGVGLATSGAGYTNATLGDAQVVLGGGSTETLLENRFVKNAALGVVPSANVTLHGVTYTSNTSSNTSSTFQVVMTNMVGTGNVLQETIASEKSPLYRKADFTLNFQIPTNEST